LKRQTKSQKFADYHDSLKCLGAGTEPHRLMGRRRDGSLPTTPVSPQKVSEATVLQECLEFLRKKGIKANRLNNGSFQTTSGWHYYGVPGAGDIMGLLPSGRHLEIETKAGRGGTLSVAQQKRMRDIRENNGLYFVVHSVEELKECFKEQVSESEMFKERVSDGNEFGSGAGCGCDEDAAEEDPEGFDPVE
jgi:hypothetical protein